jgi:lipopolysaccharide export system protein LptA
MDLLNRIRKAAFCLILSALLLFGALDPAVAADILQKKSISSGNAPVVIRSNSMEIDNKKRIVVFTGSVEAEREDMRITCQRMFVYYEGSEKTAEHKGSKIDRIVAKGDVRIQRSDGGSATAEEAVYYEAEEKIVLQGRPVVKQGEDSIEGSTITLFLREDRSVAEGGADQKVKAVLAPRNRNR